MLLFDERYTRFHPLFSKNRSYAQLYAEEMTAKNNNTAAVQQQLLQRNDQSDYYFPTDEPLDKLSPPPGKVPSNMKNRISSTSNNSINGNSNHKKSSEHSTTTDRANFMWGVWYFNEEATFLIQENDLSAFPIQDSNSNNNHNNDNDGFVISPQQWKVVKLCGRPIEFNETGVVSAMSQIDTSIPSLNISTSSTNCTLVPFDVLSTAVDELSTALNCPVLYTPCSE
jgi:hypothetical protein